jgi:hypothetical protein
MAPLLISYQKNDPRAPCFLDLPVELRQRVYRHYFHCPNEFTIHLVDCSMHGIKAPKAIISSLYSSELPADHHQLITPRNLIDDDEMITFKPRRFWPLLLVNKGILSETLGHLEVINKFTVYDPRYDSNSSMIRQYHRRLEVIPVQVERNVKHLKIDRNILDISGTFYLVAAPWTRHNSWQSIVHTMTSLQTLTVTNVGCSDLHTFLYAWTMPKIFFMNADIEFEMLIDSTLAEDEEDYEDISQITFESSSSLSSVFGKPSLPRLIIPPLSRLIFECLTSKGALQMIEKTSFAGSRLVRVGDDPENLRGVYKLVKATGA